MRERQQEIEWEKETEKKGCDRREEKENGEGREAESEQIFCRRRCGDHNFQMCHWNLISSSSLLESEGSPTTMTATTTIAAMTPTTTTTTTTATMTPTTRTTMTATTATKVTTTTMTTMAMHTDYNSHGYEEDDDNNKGNEYDNNN